MAKLDDACMDRLEKYGPIARTLSMCIRPTFIAEKREDVMIWGDWSAIEARKLPWLADTPGSRSVLENFRKADADPEVPDVYVAEAGNIHDIDAEEIHYAIRHSHKQESVKRAKGMRQEGKVATLALGFGGSVNALTAMAAGYGLHFSPERAQHIVDRWRQRNAWAVDFWRGLDSTFKMAIDSPGTPYEIGRLAFMYDANYHGGTMFCSLPCGRMLTYANLKWKEYERENAKGEKYKQKVLTYRKGYKTGALWHGILAENPTQGSAASLLQAKLATLEADRDFAIEEGRVPAFTTRGHTHDEIIGECREVDIENVKAYLKEVMEEPLDWTDGLPLVAEITTNWYYTKALD